MMLPALAGVIERRILLNYRVDPAAIAPVLPHPFRPALVGGHAIAGVCLIRFRDERPAGFPRGVGLRSENAAYRIAVEWDAEGETREGVYIPRRDTSSQFNALVGGRVFPGVHHLVEFDVHEDGDVLDVGYRSGDNQTHVRVRGREAAELPPSSVFGSLDIASRFFARGCLGFSPGRRPGTLQGLQLVIPEWRATALHIEHAECSFIDELSDGSAELDCALLMRDVFHQWRGSRWACLRRGQ